VAGRGPAPAPTALKILKGVQPKRINKREALIPGKIPAPPDVLDEEARMEWHRLAPLLEPAGLLTLVDRMGLTIVCVAWSDYIAARRTGTKTDRRSAFTQLRQILPEFGLTPSSRSRIQVNAPEPLSDVEQFKRKHG
jgi:phage terminase small subunit